MLVYSQGTAMLFLVSCNAVNFVNIVIISVQRCSVCTNSEYEDKLHNIPEKGSRPTVTRSQRNPFTCGALEERVVC
jgi:hypothetical protein